MRRWLLLGAGMMLVSGATVPSAAVELATTTQPVVIEMVPPNAPLDPSVAEAARSANPDQPIDEAELIEAIGSLATAVGEIEALDDRCSYYRVDWTKAFGPELADRRTAPVVLAMLGTARFAYLRFEAHERMRSTAFPSEWAACAALIETGGLEDLIAE